MDRANFDLVLNSDVEFEEDEVFEASLAGIDSVGFPINNFEGEKIEFELDKEFDDYIVGLVDPGGQLNKDSVIMQMFSTIV